MGSRERNIEDLAPDRVSARTAWRDAAHLEPTFFSRFECKYLVDPVLVPEVRNFLKPFAEPDPFAARRRGYRYPICSLYLDSVDLKLYHQTVGGEKDRFKLRVRTYSDDPSTPAFFEVKRKVNSIVHKRRAGVSRRRAAALLDRNAGDLLKDLPPSVSRDIEYFDLHMQALAARPVVRVKYTREAYQSNGNEPVRITIDTDLKHAVTLGNDLGHASGRWVRTPVGGSIIEVKFTERFPWWVQEFVRSMGIHQRAVPKYIMCLDHMLMEERESAVSIGHWIQPPRRT